MSLLPNHHHVFLLMAQLKGNKNIIKLVNVVLYLIAIACMYRTGLYKCVHVWALYIILSQYSLCTSSNSNTPWVGVLASSISSADKKKVLTLHLLTVGLKSSVHHKQVVMMFEGTYVLVNLCHKCHRVILCMCVSL